MQATGQADFQYQVDGTVVIFDVETNGVARKLKGHVRQIQSLRYTLPNASPLAGKY